MIKRDICQYDMLIYLCITVYPFIRIMQVFFSFAMTFNDNSPFFQSLYAVFSVEQIRILAVFFVFGGRYKKESLKPMSRTFQNTHQKKLFRRSEWYGTAFRHSLPRKTKNSFTD